jgi:hypothetical protein
MRKLVFILLGCGLLYGTYAFLTSDRRFRKYTIGKEYAIHFAFPDLARQEFTDREKADQDRDWILYSLVSAAGLDEKQFAQVTYDLAPVRYGFNNTLGNFEYGQTRAKYLGDGKVIALIPEGDEKEDQDNIAHVLDDIRKNQDQIPNKVYLFQYDLNTEGNFAHLLRRENVNGEDYFTKRMGYFESPVSSMDDLKAFMDSIDDVTYAKRDTKGLIVGGRRVFKGHYGKATPEDVATIWQSEKTIAQNAADREKSGNDLDEEYHRAMKEALDKYNDELKSIRFQDGTSFSELTVAEKDQIVDFVGSVIDDKPNVRGSNLFGSDRRSDPSVRSLITRMKKELDGIDVIYAAKAKTLNKELNSAEVPSSSGFSLDPAIDYQRSIAFVKKNRFWFSDALQGEFTVDQVLDQLQQGDGDLMEYAIAKVGKGLGGIFGLQEEATQTCMYQRARYDGEIQGTAVGMTLFYTDLLAKIWAANMFDSHPDVNITGFRDLEQTSIQTPVVFEKEESTLPDCRLWFGPNKGGFQVGQGKNDLLFSRNATQIFALSHDPGADSSITKSGKKVNIEVQASKEYEVVLSWWNNHYEEVGDFEPQYQRLNEIMKWSTIIGWLNNDVAEAAGTESLSFLNSAVVDHSLWFPTWAKSQKDLRFGDLEKINFYDSGSLGNKTEALPMLFSANRMFIGGVSLAEKSMLSEAPEVLSAENALFRRANLEADVVEGEGAFKTFRDTKIKFTEDASAQEYAVELQPKQGLKLRNRFGEVANTKFEWQITKDANGTFAVENKVADMPIGSLHVTSAEGNGFTVGFQSNAVDKGLAIGKEISDWSGDPALFFRNHPEVTRAIQADNGQWCFQVRNSDAWAVADINADPTVNLPDGWIARISGSEQQSRIVEVKWVSEDAVKTLLNGKELPQLSRDVLAVDDNHIVVLNDLAAKGEKDAIAELGTIKEQILQKAKEFEKEGEFEKAAAAAEKEIYYFGETPEVMELKLRYELQAALHSFENSDVNGGVQYLNEAFSAHAPDGKDATFFTEVNNLIDHSNLVGEMKEKIRDVAKLYYTDQDVITSGIWEGYSPVAKEVVSVDKALAEKGVRIIYADNPAFSSIDPGAPFEATVGQIRAIPGVRVYDISAEEVGKNTRAYVTVEKSFNADPAQRLAEVKLRVYPGSAYNSCQDRDKAGNCKDRYTVNGHVYFITVASLN